MPDTLRRLVAVDLTIFIIKGGYPLWNSSRTLLSTQQDAF